MNEIITIAKVIKEFFSDRFSIKSIGVSYFDIRLWFSHKRGRRLLHHQKRRLSKILSNIFGYYLVQMSILGEKPPYTRSPIAYSSSIIPKEVFNEAQKNTMANVIVAEPEALPIKNDSVDVLILHHILDYSSNPHQLLREVGRVVMPNGYVIIVGFNRFSLFNVVASCLMRSYFYRYRCFSTKHLSDWCKVLGLETVHVEYGYHYPLFNNFFSQNIDKIASRWLPFLGQYYILVARKDINARNNIPVKWKNYPVLPQLGKGAFNKDLGTSGYQRLLTKER